MSEITDDQMRSMLTRSRSYSLLLLSRGPNWDTAPDRTAVTWEHGRRNFALRADGVLNVVCPVTDDSDLCGMGIFDADEARVRELMDDDPGVAAGIFRYQVHPCRGFPGDHLATGK